MRIVALLVALLLSTGGIARADELANVSAADRAGIQAVISGQIDAFRHDDAKAAFAAAAPNIQQRFGTAQHFLGVVKELYQPVYRPRSFAFGALVMQDGELVQKVEVIAPDGTHDTALYAMVKQPDGAWRIAGCSLLQSEARET